MAKSISCPTCGENVEIPPGAAGTVIKCASCNTPIKLVSRKKPTGGAGNSDPTSIGSYVGTLGSTSTDWGDASDDPPSLGECAQCGSVLADPKQLIEDRGRLICPNCAARSTVSRREDVHSYRPRAAELDAEPTLGFREPDQIIVKHGPFIQFGLTTLAGSLAAIVAISASVWLMFHPQPMGTNKADSKPIATISLPPAPTAIDFPESDKAKLIADVQKAGDLAKGGDLSSLQQALALYQDVNRRAGAKTSSDPVAQAAIATARTRAPEIEAQIVGLKAPPPPSPEPVDNSRAPEPSRPPATPPEPEPAPLPATASSDPEPATKPGFIFAESADEIIETPRLLRAGLMTLEAKDYQRANEFFSKALKQLPPAQSGRLLAEHQVAYHGLGAALIGLKQYRQADTAINRVYRNSAESQTQSLILNRSIVNYHLDQDKFTTLDEIATIVRTKPSPEPLALMKAMLNKWKIPPTARTQGEKLLADANAQLEAEHPGEKLWGGQWVSVEEYDKLETLAARVTLLEKDLVSGELQVRVAESQLDRAIENKEDPKQEQDSLDRWKALVAEKKRELDTVRGQLPKQPATEGFEPAIPELPAGMILPEIES